MILLLASPPRSVDLRFEARKGFNLEKTGRLHKSSESAKKTCEEIKSVNPRRNFPPDSTSARSIPLSSLSLSLCFLYDPLIQCAAEQPNLDNKARREQRQKTLTAMLYKVVHPDSDNLVSAHGCRPTREWSVIVLISQHAPGTYLYVLYLTRSLYRRELYRRGVNLCDHRASWVSEIRWEIGDSRSSLSQY